MSSLKKILLGCAIVLMSFSAAKVHAAASFNSISFKPTPSQGPYFTVEGSQTLGQWGYAMGLWFELSNNSVISATLAGVRIRDIVNHQLVLTAGGAVGVTEWLDLGLTVQFVPYQNFDTPGTGVSDNGARMGDIRFSPKFRILDSEKFPVGIAIVPYVTFPTGSDTHFTGDGKITGGGVLVVESPLLWDRLRIAVNLGGDIRSSSPLSTGGSLDDRFLYGLGVNVGIIKSLEFVAEINGWTPFENIFDNNTRNMEFNGGFRIKPWRGLLLAVGGGTGILDAIGAPSYRVFGTVGWRGPTEERIEILRTNKIHFEHDKARILPQSYTILNEIVSTIKRSAVNRVTIEGHTDSTGSDVYNERLSQRRAESVRQYLISKGVSASKLSSVGRGESTPVATNETREGRALNRRVEFHLHIGSSSKTRIVEGDTAPTYLEGR